MLPTVLSKDVEKFHQPTLKLRLAVQLSLLGVPGLGGEKPRPSRLMSQSYLLLFFSLGDPSDGIRSPWLSEGCNPYFFNNL